MNASKKLAYRFTEQIKWNQTKAREWIQTGPI